MSKKIISNREANKYYSLGILFLLILIFSSLNTENAQAAVKQINIGPLLTDTSKVLMGISGSQVGIGVDPGTYNLNVLGTTNISSTTNVGGALNVTGAVTAGSFSGNLSGALSSANVSSGAFGSNTGGGNYSFPGTLGVGTTNPGYPLQISATSGDTRNVGMFLNDAAVYNPAAANTANKVVSGIRFNWYSENWQVGAARGGGVDVDGLVFSRNGSEKMVINNAGNVGIGLTNPGGAIDVNSAATAAGYWLDGKAALTGESADQWLRLNASSSWTNGIYSPGVLRVDGELRQGSADAGAYGIQTSGSLYSATGAVLAASSGNVGIGTTNPTYNLQIGADGGLINSIRIGSYQVANNTRQYIGYARADTGLFESAGDGDTTNTVKAGVSGIRIVNTPGEVTPAQADNSVQILTHTYNGGSQIALHADHRGSIGIGTTDPGVYKLNVNGNTNITGTLTATTFSGAMSGTLSAANVSAAAFGANTGGGNYSFPGSFGIGVPSPLTKLEISNQAAFNTVTPGTGLYGIHFSGQVTADYANGITWNGGSSGAQAGLYVQGSGAYGTKMYFATTDAYVSGAKTRMMIDHVGNVGIGTTNPSYSLQVSGPGTPTINVTGATGQLFVNNISPNTGTNLYLGGNVGIGATAPLAKVDILGSSAKIRFTNGVYDVGTLGLEFSHRVAGDNFPKTAILSQGDSLGYGKSNLYFVLDSASDTNGYTVDGTDTKMVILNSGNVGIGTTNPGTKLQVVGTKGSVFSGETSNAGYGMFELQGNTSNGTFLTWHEPGAKTWHMGLADAGSTLLINEDGVAGNNVIAFKTGGNVGIGTTNPLARLQIVKNSTTNNENEGGLSITSALANTNAKLILGSSGDSYGYIQSMQQNTDWSTRPLILQPNGGNVGIGTTAPGAYKLYVNGNTNINGNITATTITGAFSGTLAASNVSSGEFAANTGGGNFIFGATVSGNVGIGTTAPVSKLTIRRDGTSLSNDNFITISNRVSGVTGHVIGGILFDAYRDVRNPSNVAGIWSERTAYAGGLASDGNLVFGTELNNGRNIAIDSTLPAERMRITPAGNVGIGTTNPDAPLHAKGGTAMTSGWNRTATLDATFPGLIFNSNNNKWAGILYDYSSNFLIKVGATSNDVIASGVNALSLNATSGAATFASTLTAGGVVNADAGLSQDANVILNGSDTWLRTTGATGWYSTTYGGGWYMTDGTYIRNYGSKPVYVTGNATNPSLTFTNSGTYAIDAGGARIGNITSSLDTDAASVAYVKAATITSFNTATTTAAGGLNMGGKDIINVRKLTVNTIDPLYSINGVKYSTFASSISGGVKEEYVGKTKISSKNSDGEYERVIDFDKIEKGSDLWVWRKVIDFNKDSVDISFVPYGQSAQVYYLISGNKLIFRSDKQVEISYRLIAKRFDWRNWPTLATDQTEPSSMIIND